MQMKSTSLIVLITVYSQILLWGYLSLHAPSHTFKTTNTPAVNFITQMHVQ